MPNSRQLYDAWGNLRVKGTGLPTDVGYTGQRLDATGLMYYRARYYDPSLNRFVSADTLVPDGKNPQAFNRYAYGLNNPVKYTDPTGHDPRGCKPGQRSSACPTGKPPKKQAPPAGEYACIPGWGCFDTKHLRNFPSPGGQTSFWERFMAGVETGQDFSIELYSDSGKLGQFSRMYWIRGGLSAEQARGVAMGIFQNYSVAFEGYQMIKSSFANADLPSDYLGLVAAMAGVSPDSLLYQLGPVTYQDQETPPSSFFPQAPGTGASNYDFTPRVESNGTYQNISWPASLQVQPISSGELWGLEREEASYAMHAFWSIMTYNRDGSPSFLWCTTCGSPISSITIP